MEALRDPCFTIWVCTESGCLWRPEVLQSPVDWRQYHLLIGILQMKVKVDQHEENKPFWNSLFSSCWQRTSKDTWSALHQKPCFNISPCSLLCRNLFSCSHLDSESGITGINVGQSGSLGYCGQQTGWYSVILANILINTTMGHL